MIHIPVILNIKQIVSVFIVNIAKVNTMFQVNWRLLLNLLVLQLGRSADHIFGDQRLHKILPY